MGLCFGEVYSIVLSLRQFRKYAKCLLSPLYSSLDYQGDQILCFRNVVCSG